MNANQARLDALETGYFRRQLESIDSKVYEHKYPNYKARMLIPTQQGVDPDARVYTYRMYDGKGKARWIGNEADDLPSAEATGTEHSQVIKDLGASYRYGRSEIKAAAKTGVDLDQQRAFAARRAIEEQIDEALSLGIPALGLKGVLKLSGTTAFTTTGPWGDLASADPDDVVADLMGVAAAGVDATNEAFTRYVVVLPLAQYQVAAQLKMSGVTSGITCLQFAKATSPYIEDIIPWYRCENAAANGTDDKIAAFPRDPECVAALVPQELQFLPPQERNLSYVINGVASCGGVVCRYPKAVVYGDNI